MQRIPILNHAPINFYFTQTPRDFVVKEVALYEACGFGEHLMIEIRKKGLSTTEMINLLSSILGCAKKEIGYAGLKDKNALTTQYITLPLSLQAKLTSCISTLEEKQIKILSISQHNNKLRIGHLKGNEFFIRLKKVSPTDAKKLELALEQTSKIGIPNYFGYQRFGKFGDNHLEGQKLVQSNKKLSNKKLQEFLISSYQSHLFNQWLSQRIIFSKLINDFPLQDLPTALQLANFPPLPSTILKSLKSQPHPFKILEGELMHHYPFGKLFALENLHTESQRFNDFDIAPCGILSGKKITLPSGYCKLLQDPYLDLQIKDQGSHRFAFVLPQNIKSQYFKEKAHFELSFFLPKGSYATILLENLAQKEIQENQGEE